MSDLAPRRRSLYELLLLSDFARGNPERARELLERCADPLTESRDERQERDCEAA